MDRTDPPPARGAGLRRRRPALGARGSPQPRHRVSLSERPQPRPPAPSRSRRIGGLPVDHRDDGGHGSPQAGRRRREGPRLVPIARPRRPALQLPVRVLLPTRATHLPAAFVVPRGGISRRGGAWGRSRGGRCRYRCGGLGAPPGSRRVRGARPPGERRAGGRVADSAFPAIGHGTSLRPRGTTRGSESDAADPAPSRWPRASPDPPQGGSERVRRPGSVRGLPGEHGPPAPRRAGPPRHEAQVIAPPGGGEVRGAMGAANKAVLAFRPPGAHHHPNRHPGRTHGWEPAVRDQKDLAHSP